MKVLLTCKYLPPEAEGGGALTIHALARALVREGVQVTLLKARARTVAPASAWDGLEVFETEYRDRFDFRERGMTDFYGHLTAKGFNQRSYVRALRALATPGRFDLVHAQNHTTALAAAAAKGDLGVPLAATLRGHGLWCFVLGKRLPDGSPCSGCVTANQLPCLGTSTRLPNPVKLPALAAMKAWMSYQGRLAREIDLMLPISTMMAEEAKAYGRPVRIIPDLVDERSEMESAAVPDDVAALLRGRRPGQRIALYAGRLAPNKGIDLVLDAARRAPSWFFVIAGDDAKGEYGPILRARAEQERIDNVRFAGWVTNAAMPALYAAVDVVLLPFLRPEPLSRGMVEALSLGKPLAATAHGGPLDGVEDGRNGVLFHPGVEGLVEALARLDAADLEVLGARSREVYDDRFRASSVVRAHIEAYEWLLSRGGAR